MVTVSGLSKSYKGKKVVDRLSFTVEEGELFALLGSNGAGKSTTIKMMLGLIRSDEGSVGIPPGVRVGYSPETSYFPGFLTGMEVLAYYGRLQKLPGKTMRKTGEALLDLVRLENDRTKIRFYSKGMLQRLALAQALLGDPQLLILDEPCAGLDAMGRVEMLELIGRLKAQGKSILMNSHILSDIEKVCDRGIILQKGRILRTFTREQLAGEGSLEKIFVETVGGGEQCM